MCQAPRNLAVGKKQDRSDHAMKKLSVKISLLVSLILTIGLVSSLSLADTQEMERPAAHNQIALQGLSLLYGDSGNPVTDAKSAWVVVSKTIADSAVIDSLNENEFLITLAT
jgi:hypothetical protein